MRADEQKNTVLVARLAAVALGVGTVGFLATGDGWRGDNPFLVPDLILSVLLVAAAFAPVALAVPALVFGFGLSAGVLGVSVATYAVDGRLGAASLVGAVVAVVMSAVVGRVMPMTRSSASASASGLPGAAE